MYRRLRRIAAFLFVVIVCSIVFAVAFWWRWAKRPFASSPSPTPTRITIAPGASVEAVGRDLEAKGIIRSWRAFWWLGRGKAIKPGVYDVNASYAPTSLLRKFEQGDVAKIRVTFPEGFTLQRMADRLQAKGLINNPDAFLALTARQGTTFNASFPPPANLEGYLFPDTYDFPIGSDDRKIAQRMLDNFDRRVARGLESDLKASGRSLAEVVNVAAMIEREAEVDQDRPLIAGVIYNRLQKGMRLQIDATVQYARGQHKSRLFYKDLEVDSPYNTYKVAGLPAGPICNPGLPSIEAAIKPAKTDVLFYVGRPGQAHLFSRTFAEHQQNIALLKRRDREQGR